MRMDRGTTDPLMETTMAMTYAQALSEAKNRILEQKQQLETSAATLKQQKQEIAQRKANAAELKKDLNSEVEKNKTLELEMTRVTGAKEAAESTVGRQRVQLDQLENASAQQQEMIESQTQQIAELTARIESLEAELDATRAKLPTDEDIAALRDVSALLGGEQPEPSLRIEPEANSVDGDCDPNAETDAPGMQQPHEKKRTVFCFTRAAA